MQKVLKRSGPWVSSGGVVCAACMLVMGIGEIVSAQQATILLRPDVDGPYQGGEVLTVDIALRNLTSNMLPLTFVRLDYVDTSDELNLPPGMTWQLNPPQAGNPTLPRPVFEAPSPTLNVVPSQGTIRLGTVQVALPRTPGCYFLDVMNSDDTDNTHGAEIRWINVLGGPVIWRARTGDLSGGLLPIRVGTTVIPEICNGRDDDCDGMVDEGFTIQQFDPETGRIIDVGQGGRCVIGKGNCEVRGRLRCRPDGSALDCVPIEEPRGPQPEGPYLNPTCFNQDDDDCDGLVDFEDPDCQGPEICDGLDNNFNGETDELWPELGEPCTAGQGACAQPGVFICSPNRLLTVCSAEPLEPSTEGPPGWFNCDDGFDNDCDGRIDLQDPDCQSDEVCDGKDNDGDGQKDEDFPQLGDTCTVGVGVCRRTGVFVCLPDGSGVVCSADQGPKSPEGPGCDCGDGVDNDCDGLIDLDDPDCGGDILRVHATLTPTCQSPDGDCKSWHTIEWTTLNAGPGLVETGEILALGVDGTVLGTLPVMEGDVVRLTSRVPAAELSMMSLSFMVDLAFYDMNFLPCMAGVDVVPPLGCQFVDTDCDGDVDLADAAWMQNHFGEMVSFHEVAAPKPVLRVTANDGIGRAHAYVSPVPHMQVWAPDETVVSLFEGDRTRVEVAIPGIDLATLEVYIDGVSVFPALGINPAADLPGGPFGGDVVLPNDCTAHICGLVVEAGDLSTPTSNTLTMIVENMCCGGHRIRVRGAPLPGVYPMPVPAACDFGPFTHSGVSHGFEVRILNPADGAVDPAPPTGVVGLVCHGLKLASPTPSAGGMVKLNGALFPMGLPVLSPGDGLFTADKYTYSFEGNLGATNLFEDMFIGIGVPGRLDPGGNKLIAECEDPLLNTAYDVHHIAVGPVAMSAAAGGGDAAVAGGMSDAVAHGVTVVATEGALNTIVTEALTPLASAVVQQISNALNALRGTEIEIPTDACDARARLLTDNPVPFGFSMDPNAFTFDVQTTPNQVDITVTSGPAHAQGSVRGSCQINGLFGECFIRVKVKVGAMVDIDEATLTATITENDLLTQADVTPSLVINPADIEITVGDVGSDVECWGGVLAEILTFGTIDNIISAVVEDEIDDFLADLDLTQLIGLIPVPPIPLDVIDFDPVNIEALKISFEFNLSEVEINNAGLTAGFETTFTPTEIDPEVEELPGFPETIATLPLPPLAHPGAEGVTALVSDDAINQLLHALTRNGVIKTEFEDHRQLQDILPADCSTLPPVQYGQCEAVKGTLCTTLPGQDEIDSCLATTFLLAAMNLSGSTPILLHGRVDVPPKFFIFRTQGLNTVVGFVRLSQAFVGIVADRDGEGVFSGDYDEIPSCFAGNLGSATECSLFGSCFNVNFDVNLALGNAPDGSPRLQLSLTDSNLSTATGCSGGTSTPGAQDAFEAIFEGQVFDLIRAYVDNNVPPLDLRELDFNGIISLQNLATLVFGNEFDPVFDDTFGLTFDPAP